MNTCDQLLWVSSTFWPTGAADQWGSLWPGPGGGQWGRCSGGGRSLSDALLPELQERGWGQSHLHETDRGLREEKRGLPDRRGMYDLWPHCLNPCSSLWLQWHFKSDAASCFGHLGATETSCGQFLIKMTTAALKTITSGLWISCFVLYKVHSIFSGYFSWLDVCVVLQYFEHVEEAEWAVQVLKTTGKPVAASLCIGPDGDLNRVSPGDCAVRLVNAGTTTSHFTFLLNIHTTTSWGFHIISWHQFKHGSELPAWTLKEQSVRYDQTFGLKLSKNKLTLC